jgi:hypothetical protein
MKPWILMALLTLAGCANPTRNVYDGLQGQSRSQLPPSEAAARPGIVYDDYEKERSRLRNEAR